MTRRNPFLSMPCSLAIWLAASNNSPRSAASLLPSISVVYAIGCLGIIIMWTGAWGFISLKANIVSDSKTISAGISFRIILEKIVSAIGFTPIYLFHIFSSYYTDGSFECQALRLLYIQRSHLYSKMKKYGIDKSE